MKLYRLLPSTELERLKINFPHLKTIPYVLETDPQGNIKSIDTDNQQLIQYIKSIGLT